MKYDVWIRWALVLGASAWFSATSASAQVQPGDPQPYGQQPAPYGQEPAPYGQPAPEPQPVSPAPVAPAPVAAAPAQESAEDAGDADAESDHAAVVGHTAVGYLGLASVPVGGPLVAIGAPVIGIRRWTSERVGLDLGVGLGLDRTSSRAVPDMGDSTPGPRQLGLAGALHVGMPIAFFHRRHYAFLLVPEADIGFAFAKDDPDPDLDDDELKHLGVLLQPGVRAGSEVHFGFVGIPQLSLQASVGVRASYAWTQTKDAFDNRLRNHDISLGTTVQSSPWNIFIANVAALYYF